MDVTPSKGIVVHQGSLAISKRHVLKSRKKRWFVLEQGTATDQDEYSLRFYKDRSRTYLDGEVPMADVTTLISRRVNSFRLTTRTKKTYDLKADNEREKIVWMARLQEIVGKQEAYYVQMTSAQEVCPVDSLLRVTQGDLVLLCPVSALPTHSWKVANLHSFGTSGPQLWLQKCGKCNADASALVYLTIGSGVATCEEIFHQVCTIAGGNITTQDSTIPCQPDSLTGHGRICYLSAHQGHEQHTPPPTPQQGRSVLLNRALSPEAVGYSSAPDDVWSSKSINHDQDSGISTRSNSGILNAAVHYSPYHTSAIRQGSLPIPSRSMSVQRRLRKGSLPLLDYPVSSASCGSLDTFNKIAEDEPLPARLSNRDQEDVFVFMQCPPPQPPPRIMPTPATSSSSDSLPQMMKNTRAVSPPLPLLHSSPISQHGPPPSPPIPPRPATTLESNQLSKRKYPST